MIGKRLIECLLVYKRTTCRINENAGRFHLLQGLRVDDGTGAVGYLAVEADEVGVG